MKPLVIFVHIPKTAGSSLNRVLSDWQSGVAHAEGFWSDRNQLADKARHSSWISGHIPMPRFIAGLRDVTRRPFQLVTIVRDPSQQIASHYNWLIEIFHRGRSFYEGHPESIKLISERIRATRNDRPQEIIAQLSAASGLFLNQQCRVAIGADVTGWSAAQIRRGLVAYDLAGTEEQFDQIVQLVTGRQPSSVVRENASRYHFDPTVFRTPELVEFLKNENAGDIALYEAMRLDREA